MIKYRVSISLTTTLIYNVMAVWQIFSKCLIILLINLVLVSSMEGMHSGKNNAFSASMAAYQPPNRG